MDYQKPPAYYITPTNALISVNDYLYLSYYQQLQCKPINLKYI